MSEPCGSLDPATGVPCEIVEGHECDHMAFIDGYDLHGLYCTHCESRGSQAMTAQIRLDEARAK